jgi:carbon monoxide dehydrogenase subunit G
VIEINERLDIPAATAHVWRVISDPAAVVRCVEGAALDGPVDNGYLPVSLVVKFGPMRVRFTGRATLTLDERTHVGELAATGTDGQATRVRARSSFAVSETSPASAAVVIAGRIELTGKLAALIESGAAAVVRRMTKEFAEALSAACVAADGSADTVPPSQPGWMRRALVKLRRMWRARPRNVLEGQP